MNLASKIPFLVMIVINMLATSEGCWNFLTRKKREIGYPTVPEADSELSGFFTTCLNGIEPNIFPSMQSVVDLSIRDANWFNASKNKICLDEFGRNNSECWISNLMFHLDPVSPLYISTAQCICNWFGDCPDNKRKKKRSIRSSHLNVYDELGLLSSYRECEPTELEETFSQCIEDESSNFTDEYPSLNDFDAESISMFFKNHYTYCRFEVMENLYDPEQRFTFGVLRLDEACPREGNESVWRKDLITTIEDAVISSSPVGIAYESCKARLQEEGVEEFVGIPCEDVFKACNKYMHCSDKVWRRQYCRKTCGYCVSEDNYALAR